MTSFPIAALSMALAGAGTGCSDQTGAAAQPATALQTRAASAEASEVPEILATIRDQSVSMEDIRARVGDELAMMDTRYRVARHRLIDTTLQSIVRERLLNGEAARQNKTVEQVLAGEIGRPLDPTASEIEAWYRDNQARIGGRSLASIRQQIANYLRQQRQVEAAEKLKVRVAKDYNVDIKLEPYRIALNNTGSPTMGPATAPVTLVEFSDFDCPFCGRFHGSLRELANRFGDRLQIVYRQHPIPSLHPNAFKAAEASLCAHDQGKFWQMHDVMFQEQGRLSVTELKEKAVRIGLDASKFNGCLDSGRRAEQVQADLREGSRAGITGTPALFVNGVEIPGGAVSTDSVARVIERELTRGQR